MIFRAAVLSLLSSLVLLQLATAARAPAPSPTVVVASPTAHTPTTSIDARSTRLTPDTVMVDVRRDEIERLLPKALSSARAVPHLTGGHVDGLRLYGVHKDSLWRTLGLRNGDVVRSYNGRPVTDASMLSCLGDCPGSPDHLDLTVNRRGRTVRIVVLIHSA